MSLQLIASCRKRTPKSRYTGKADEPSGIRTGPQIALLLAAGALVAVAAQTAASNASTIARRSTAPLTQFDWRRCGELCPFEPLSAVGRTLEVAALDAASSSRPCRSFTF